MKLGYVIVLGVILGCAVGVGTTWAKLGWDSATFDPVEGSPGATAVGRARLRVDAQEHDFGTIERDAVVRHVFRVTNVGDAPATFKEGHTTCLKCTIAELPQSVIRPGETIDITVEYRAAARKEDFRQTATIPVQGDPDRPRIELTVFGHVAEMFEVRPWEIVFNKADHSVNVQVLSYVADDLDVLKCEFLEEESAALFEAQVLPMPAEQLAEAKAKSGRLVRVTAKPGLPLGPVRQKLRLETNVPNNAQVEIPIQGTVASDIAVMGKGFNPGKMVLHCGVIKGSEGARHELIILVRGPHRGSTQFPPEQVKVEPDFLRVSVGEPTEVTTGAAVRIPLVIEIPPGSPNVSHLGGAQGEPAQITLGTTHPVTKEVRLSVQFAIDNQK